MIACIISRELGFSGARHLHVVARVDQVRDRAKHREAQQHLEQCFYHKAIRQLEIHSLFRVTQRERQTIPARSP